MPSNPSPRDCEFEVNHIAEDIGRLIASRDELIKAIAKTNLNDEDEVSQYRNMSRHYRSLYSVILDSIKTTLVQYALARVRAFAEGLKEGTFNNLELIGHSEFCLGANDAIVRFKNYIDRALAEMEGK